MIPFNKPFLTGKEIQFITEAHERGQLAGDGYFTKKCNAWLEETTGCHKALLTHSCTAALEMAAILADLQPGDEVIMPSYTFVSTANAFVLCGCVPVFVDIRADTLNIDEQLIENAITSRTKAIVPVHYAGVACDMERIMAIARKHNLLVIEDAAQSIKATYRGQVLGSIGDLGCYSFHETKNIIAGEGGALLINNPTYADRAEIIREKGTNRSQFFRGDVDKYTWVDKGSSYLPGELIAAFLYAQLEESEKIIKERQRLWGLYHESIRSICDSRPFFKQPSSHMSDHNAHMYYLLFHDSPMRDLFISTMKRHGVNCVFHYVPLHSSPYGQQHGRIHGDVSVTNKVSSSIVRLPLYIGLETEKVVQAIDICLREMSI